jgi:hypothetical protein
MTSVECPQCFRRLRAPDDAIRKRVRCTSCGHDFVLKSVPTPRFENETKFSADYPTFVPEPPAVPKLPARKESIWTRPIFKSSLGDPRRTAGPMPTHGPIVCRYCSVTIAENVHYLGQNIPCPSCHGSLFAPGGNRVNNLRTQAEIASARMVIQLIAFLFSCGWLLWLLVH